MAMSTWRVAQIALVVYFFYFVMVPRQWRFEDARYSARERRRVKPPPRTVVRLPAYRGPQQSFDVSNRRIPLVIHQGGPSGLVDHEVADASRAWRMAAERGFFEYKFHDGAAQDTFVRDACGDVRGLCEAYEAETSTEAEKHRLWRALLLYVEGGVYADLDTTLARPNDLFLQIVRQPDVDALAGCVAAATYRGSALCRVDTGVMAYGPGHPILAEYLASFPGAVRLGEGATGPGLLAASVAVAGFRPTCDGELAFSADRRWNVRTFPAAFLDGAARRVALDGVAPPGDADDADDPSTPPRWWPPGDSTWDTARWGARNVTCLWRDHPSWHPTRLKADASARRVSGAA